MAEHDKEMEQQDDGWSAIETLLASSNGREGSARFATQQPPTGVTQPTERDQAHAASMSTFQRLMIGTGRSVAETIQGAKQIYTQVGEKAGFLPPGSLEKLTEEIAEEAALWENSAVAKTTAGKIGDNFLGPALQAAVPGAAVGTSIKAAGLLAAGEGLLQPVLEHGEETQGRMINMATYGVAGLAGSWGVNAITGVVSRTAQRMRGAANGTTIQREATNNVMAEAVKESQQAAQKLNTWLSPAESYPAGFGPKGIVDAQEKLVLTKPAAIELSQRLVKREQGLQKEMDSIMHGLVPEGWEAASQHAANLYGEVLPMRAGQAIEVLAESYPAVNKALQLVRNGDMRGTSMSIFGEGYEKMATAPGTIGEIHQVRQALQAMAGNQPGQIPYAAANEMKDTLKRLMGDLTDGQSDIMYDLAQRMKVSRKLEEAVGGTAANSPLSSRFYTAFLATDNKMNDFLKEMDHMIDQGLATRMKDQFKTFATVVRGVANSDLERMATARLSGEQLQASGVGGWQGIILFKIQEMKRGAHDKALMEYMTSPTWAQDMGVISGKEGNAQAVEFMKRFINFSARTGQQARTAAGAGTGAAMGAAQSPYSQATGQQQ